MLTLLDMAQRYWFTRFLRSPHDGLHWIVEPELYFWAKGLNPYPNLATVTWPTS